MFKLIYSVCVKREDPSWWKLSQSSCIRPSVTVPAAESFTDAGYHDRTGNRFSPVQRIYSGNYFFRSGIHDALTLGLMLLIIIIIIHTYIHIFYIIFDVKHPSWELLFVDIEIKAFVNLQINLIFVRYLVV